MTTCQPPSLSIYVRICLPKSDAHYTKQHIHDPIGKFFFAETIPSWSGFALSSTVTKPVSLKLIRNHMRTLKPQSPYCVHTYTRVVCKYPSARNFGSSVTRRLFFRPTGLLEITMSLHGSLTLGRRCKAMAKPPRRHCTLSADLADEQAWADIVRDADQDPSPWCDMGDIDYRVFNVDQCGHASITDPYIAGC